MRARALRAHVYRDEMTMKTPAGKGPSYTHLSVEWKWGGLMT